jgi:hypothetical protein
MRDRPNKDAQAMISAYEHGQNAARHGKHIQACPFDPGTAQWREWRDGFAMVSWLIARNTGKVWRMCGRFSSVTSGAIIVLCDYVCAVERAGHLVLNALNGTAADATFRSNLEHTLAGT